MLDYFTWEKIRTEKQGKDETFSLIFSEELPQGHGDYRPVFFQGHPPWLPESSHDHSLQSARSIDERQSTTLLSNRVYAKLLFYL